MTIGDQIKQKVAAIPAGVVFTISDFGFDPSNDMALAKALSRMATAGELCKVSKEKYYKPKETVLGMPEKYQPKSPGKRRIPSTKNSSRELNTLFLQ